MLFAISMRRTTEAVLIFTFALGFLSNVQSQRKRYEARKHWWDLAQNELAAALNVRQNTNVAKNVIMFLGDGMGITASTAGRIYKGQLKGMHGEEGYLAWERFPNMGLLKTYNVDRQVPDSAATATAYLCGVKTNYYTLGVDSDVQLGDCEASKNTINHTPSILQWAQEAGKHTGIVTTTRVTHATPAGTYAHSSHRNWECDGKLGVMGQGCKDIADQLITDNPGRDIRVILGGGRQMFGAQLSPPEGKLCSRQDGRNLAREWAADKARRGYNAAYVTDSHELSRVNPANTDYLMGLFNDTHMPFEVDRQENFMPVPSLKEMTLVALKFLQKSEKGFFLLVEGGRIDHALHDNLPKKALTETVALDEAVQAALMELDLEDTLVLATADHSHVMTLNGYPARGNDILGVGDISKIDGLPYTTLMFTNGPGWKYTAEGNNVYRTDPRTEDLHSSNYQSLAGVPRGRIDETHGGEDVAVFAVGPMSHLFHRVHEQNYVAHVMAYAACIGPSKGVGCERPASNQHHFMQSPRPRPPFESPAPTNFGGVSTAHATANISIGTGAVNTATTSGAFSGVTLATAQAATTSGSSHAASPAGAANAFGTFGASQAATAFRSPQAATFSGFPPVISSFAASDGAFTLGGIQLTPITGAFDAVATAGAVTTTGAGPATGAAQSALNTGVGQADIRITPGAVHPVRALGQECNLPQCSAQPHFVIGPKFPTISPLLQQLIDSNEQKITEILGKSAIAISDIEELDLDRRIGHSL